MSNNPESAANRDSYRATLLVGWVTILLGFVFITVSIFGQLGVLGESNPLLAFIGLALWAAGYIGCVILPTVYRRMADLERRIADLEKPTLNTE